MTWSLRNTLIAAAVAALPAVVALAGENPRVASDHAAIERAVRDYVDAIYDVDPSKIERSVHPDMVKRGFFHGSDGRYAEHFMNYEELLLLAAEWNAEGQTDVTAAPREVRILDVLDQTATARLEAYWGIDYMHLARFDGKWKIIHVLWQAHPKEEPVHGRESER
jgi:hypothetical protein